MKKEFLDKIYDLRNRVILDIERLIKNNDNPIQHCKLCQSECNENMAELRTRRSQLSSIDETIETYLKLH